MADKLTKEEISKYLLQLHANQNKSHEQFQNNIFGNHAGNPDLMPKPANQTADMDLNNLMQSILLNPLRVKVSRTNIIDNQGVSTVLSETKEGSRVHPKGYIEDIREENIHMLDDGESTGEVVICQTHRGKVLKKNIRRCIRCRIVCCISHRCTAIYSRSENVWYCGLWCSLLDAIGF